MTVATERYFLGRWQMVRLIESPTGGSLGEFWGEAAFDPEPGARLGAEAPVLACRESGVLRYEGHDYAAGRVTLWRFARDGRVEVFHEDGKPFHAFTAEAAEGVHLCGADRYEVGYEFLPGSWRSRWRVTGPAKDYWMTTRYTRIPDPASGRGPG